MSKETTYAPGLVRIHDKTFEPLLSAEEIRLAVLRLARQMSQDFAGKDPLFVVVLNGAFIFAADLIRAAELDPAIVFIRISSYQDMHTTGTVREVLGLNEDVRDREVVVIEDIVDSGHTVAYLDRLLREKGASGVTFAALLLKEDAYQYDIPVTYVGFRIPNRFVVGCGLDYNGYGRSLDCVYVLKD